MNREGTAENYQTSSAAVDHQMVASLIPTETLERCDKYAICDWPERPI